MIAPALISCRFINAGMNQDIKAVTHPFNDLRIPMGARAGKSKCPTCRLHSQVRVRCNVIF